VWLEFSNEDQPDVGRYDLLGEVLFFLLWVGNARRM